ncbi:MAG: AI-2E family transporter [Anaerolineales bacterium]|nr:AI-2E family transporter [Anaerolineales bacterium]MCB8951733.1 AI-2E family transporter [Ardenticatenales bacterium]
MKGNQKAKQQEQDGLPDFGPSPPWSSRGKRAVASGLIIVLLLFIYQLRGVLLPVIMAVVVAYVVLPIVNLLHQRTRLNRNLSIAIVYLLFLAILLAIPITAIPSIINQANALIERTPEYLQSAGEFLSRPIHIAGFTIPLDQYPVLDQIYVNLADNLVQIAQSIGRESVNVLGNVAGATLSTIAWIIIVLVLSFYMVKDFRQLFDSAVHLIPQPYQADMYRLGYEISVTWNAFLRGQLLLCLVVGIATFCVALLAGLPNALVLAIIAGIAEFVPNLGPTLAAIPAVLVALFQSHGSWLGANMSPLLYAAIILGLYILIQQVENIVLVPRIIGRSLNLHPFVVFLGAIIGANVAGILGILLAAPILATMRLLLIYMFRKISDLPPFPLSEPAGRPQSEPEPVPALSADTPAGGTLGEQG